MERDEQDILDDLLDLESGLTDWEVAFIEDLEKRRDRPMTARQRVKLVDIGVERLGAAKRTEAT